MFANLTQFRPTHFTSTFIEPFWLKTGSIGLISAVGFYMLRKWAAGGVCKTMYPIEGKIIVITGANSGIGFEAAKELARWGATVVMACRDMASADAAGHAIRREILANPVAATKGRILVEELDLLCPDSIRAFVSRFLKLCHGKLDHLILNAGVMLKSRELVHQGVDKTFYINTVGHFILVKELWDTIIANKTRVITVSSALHKRVSLSIDPSTKKHIIPDLMGEQSWDSMMNYSKSKMAGLMLAFEFGRRLAGTGAVSVALHPGVVRTGLSRHTNPFMRYIFHFVLGFFGKSPWQGCQTTLYCCTAKMINMGYYGDCVEQRASDAAYDEECAKWVWELCEKLSPTTKP